METIKDRIKIIRKSKGYNQTEFGKMLNLSQNAIATYESGARNISDRTIADICRVFSINEEWLRYGSGEMESVDTESKINEYIRNELKNENSDLIFAMQKLASMTQNEWNEVYNLIQQFKK